MEQARADVAKSSDPRTEALFETTAEVLLGLCKAFEDFEQRREMAWKQAGRGSAHNFSIHSEQMAQKRVIDFSGKNEVPQVKSVPSTAWDPTQPSRGTQPTQVRSCSNPQEELHAR
jgi:hypothetical protein